MLFALPSHIYENIDGELNCFFRHARAKSGSIYVVECPPRTSKIAGLDCYGVHSLNVRSLQLLIIYSHHGRNRHSSFESVQDWPRTA
jgi:hypothetical protein